MRTISIRLEDLQKIVLPLGFEGENQYTQVRIDSKTIYDEFPNATFGLTVVPPIGDAYPGVVTRDGDIIVWNVSSADLTVKGNGEIQLAFINGGVIAKSYVARTNIMRSIVPTGEMPDPVENWIEAAQEVLGEFENATAEAETLDAGSEATVELDDEDGHKVFKFGIPKGRDGTEIIDDVAGTGDTDKTWSADKLTTEFAGKANAVESPTDGNVVSLDENGDLVDSGKTLGVSVPADAAFTDTVPMAIYSSKEESTLGDIVIVTIKATFSLYAKRAWNVFALIIPSDLMCGQIGKGTQFKLKINNTKTQTVFVNDNIQFNTSVVMQKGIYYVYDDESYYYMRGDGLSTPKINGKTIGYAIEKGVDTSISPGSTSTNLPTSQAVENRVSAVAGAKADLVDGKVPSSQLPSYVDDVLEYEDVDHFPATGESGKIYIALDTNKTYRWGGSTYVEISESLALGETENTAYRGDRGKTAYDHASAKGSAFASGLYKVTTNAEGHVTNATAVVKNDITNLGIPGQDTTYSAATQSADGLMSVADKTKLDGIDMSTKVNTSDFRADAMPMSALDSTKVATAIGTLKSALTNVIDGNEFVAADATTGKRIGTNGAPTDYTNGFISDYMPVIGGVKYQKNSPTEDLYHRIYYTDESKTIIGSPVFDNVTTAPNNAVYAVIGGLTSELSTTVFSAVSAKDLIAREKLEQIEEKGISIDKVYAENPGVLDTGSFSKQSGVSKDSTTGDITIERSSGNGYFTYKAIKSKLVDYFVIVEFDIVITSGQFSVQFFGYNSENTQYNESQLYMSQSGHYKVSVDLNYQVMYNDLDLTKDVRFGIVNKTTPAYAVVKNFSLSTPKYTFNVDEEFYTNVNQMYEKINANENAITELVASEYLVAPNGTKYTLYVDNNGELHTRATAPNNVLIVGNSLLLGFGLFGASASSADNDYYHYVSQKILELNPSATFDRMSGTAFEACTSSEDAQTWMTGTLLSHLGNTVDLVIVQLGDNVNTPDKVSAFATTCSQLLAYIRSNAQNARIAWVGEWYSSAQKQAIIANACAENGAVFVDISTIRNKNTVAKIGNVVDYGVSASRNYTIDSYTDDATNHKLTVVFTVNDVEYTSVVPYDSYSVSGTTLTITGNYGIIVKGGAASHPGDSGMLLIGNLINEKLGFN